MRTDVESEDGVLGGPAGQKHNSALRTGEAPLKILIHGINFAPELTGIGRYTGDMAAWLAEQGHTVRVVTSYPYYPHWRLAPGYPVWRWSRERLSCGVEVLRCPLWVPAQPRGWTRILHLASFAFSSGPLIVASALTFRPHLVFTVEPTSVATPWALLAARLTGARAWLHVQDIELGAAERLGLLGRDHWVAKLAVKVYRRLLRGFDYVTTLSERMRAKLAECGRPASAIELFPNWVDTEKTRPVDAAAMRAELGLLSHQVCVLYAGNLGQKQGIESLLDTAALCGDEPDIRFVICGAGALRSSLEDNLRDHPNVQLLDPLPDERFIELLSAADIHVLPQRRGITHYVMPSKLAAMMASGRAIIAQADESCAVRDILDGRAVLVPPEATADLAQAIRDLARRDGARRRAYMGARLREKAREFAREDVLARAFALMVRTQARPPRRNPSSDPALAAKAH